MTYNDIVTWWQKKNLSTYEDYVQVLNNFNIVFTCNSNSIEDINVPYHTTREIFEDAVLSSVSGLRPRDIFEVKNHKFAYDKMIRSLVTKEPLSVELIKDLHKILLYGSYDDVRWHKGERPGEFKKGDYCIGMTSEGSTPEDVHYDLSELLDEVNNTAGDPLVKAVYFHVQFESIHPFADGNGRLGRMLMNYLLMLSNYPPVTVFAEDKTVYYMGLEVFDRTGKIDGLVAFIKEQTMKMWGSRLKVKKPYTDKQIALARKYAPTSYLSKSDDELWEAIGDYIKSIGEQ